MTRIDAAVFFRALAAGLLLLPAAGCDTLKPSNSQPPMLYSLDRAADPAAPQNTPRSQREGAPALAVSLPHAFAGFDSSRIMYVRDAHKLEYFAHNEWADTPASMLQPLVVGAMTKSGAFRVVVSAPSHARVDLRLETEVVRLQHEFLGSPTRVRFTLRAYLIDERTRRVLAVREFDAVEPAASANPYGGVVAANSAVRAVLEQLAAFGAEAASGWQPAAADAPKRGA